MKPAVKLEDKFKAQPHKVHTNNEYGGQDEYNNEYTGNKEFNKEYKQDNYDNYDPTYNASPLEVINILVLLLANYEFLLIHLMFIQFIEPCIRALPSINAA